MDRIVPNGAHLVRHPQRHATHVLDEDHDERGHDDVPADDEEGADDLEADLAAVTCDGAAGVGDTEGFAAFDGGPETCWEKDISLGDFESWGMGRVRVWWRGNLPVPTPPTIAPTKWVWKTSRVSSTCRMIFVRPRTFIETQGTVPEPSPSRMAPHPATTPAAGVMATKPVIIPCTAPMTDGLLKKMRSIMTQTRSETAVQIFVLSTATPASGEAAYGSPPLKPFHPVHKIPAPTSMRVTLLGFASTRSAGMRGPIHHAPTNPAVPEDK